MHQPMQGARAQVKTDSFAFYDHGWNAFIAGEPFDRAAAFDWRSGWKDCEQATKKYGQQPKI